MRAIFGAVGLVEMLDFMERKEGWIHAYLAAVEV